MASIREILAGRAAVEITLRDKLKAGLDVAKQRLQNFAVSVAAIGISFQTLANLASRAMGTIGDVFTGPADQLQNLADRTGISTDMLQALAESGADSGATLEDVGAAARAMANFLQTAERGGESAARTLADLGMSADSLTGASQDQRIAMFADALGGIADPARRAALAQDIFGRGAMNLLPILGSGAKGIDVFRKRLEETGALKSSGAIEAADKIGDAFGKIGRRLKDVGWNMLAAIAPALDKISAAAVGVVEAFNKFIADHPVIAKVLATLAVGAIGATVAIAALTGAVMLAGAVASAAATAWGFLTAAVGAASAVFAVMATPVGIIVGLVVALVAAMAALVVALMATTDTGQAIWLAIKTAFTKVFEFVTKVLGGIFDAIATGNWALAGQIALAALQVVWVTGWGKIKTTTASAMAWIGATMIDAMGRALYKLSRLINLHIAGINVVLRSIGADEIKFRASNLVAAANLASNSLRNGAKGYADEVAQGVQEARDNLDELTKKAEGDRKKREDALKVPKLPETVGDAAGGGKEDIGKAAAKAAKDGFGTWSATLAGRVGQSVKTDSEIAKNTLDAANALIEINRKIKAGKLVVVE